jgi:hypothetical protein
MPIRCKKLDRAELLMVDADAFWAHGRRVANGCLEWTPEPVAGFEIKRYNNYQTFTIRDFPAPGLQRCVPVHRLAYALAYGLVPADTFVCHHCDNPPCYEPTHLFLGTQHDNTRDSSEKIRRRHAIEARSRFAALPNETMFLTGIEAAGFLGISPLTLAEWRKSGESPDYRRHGRRVIYSRDDLIAWSEARSTSAAQK